MAGARGCFNCGGYGHQAAACPKVCCLRLSRGGLEGHVSRDCTAEPKAKTCYKCNQEGHISRDCPENVTQTSTYSGGGGYASSQECYRCGKTGHIARQCPDTSAGGYQPAYGAFSGGSQRTCFTCGGVGHLSRDCVQGSKCYNCSGFGHISKDCPQPQKRACYTCGSEGHISRDCPQANGGAPAAEEEAS